MATKKTENQVTEDKVQADEQESKVTEDKVQADEQESGYFAVCSLTSLKGIINPGQKVEASFFNGGIKTLADLESRGLVIEK